LGPCSQRARQQNLVVLDVGENRRGQDLSCLFRTQKTHHRDAINIRERIVNAQKRRYAIMKKIDHLRPIARFNDIKTASLGDTPYDVPQNARLIRNNALGHDELSPQ
jgi:hypothetical protein